MPTPTETAVPASFVEVTFYDLSGFLIQIGDKKILVDALFGWFPRYAPPQEAFDRMSAGEPPFDEIDLVLVTHNHPDHFSADVASGFLQENPETALVSTSQVVRSIEASGIELVNPIYSINIAAGERETITLEGIEIECLYISHGIPDFLNLGFVVTVGQVSFFHSGDLSTEAVSVDDLLAYQIPEKQLDLAFIPIQLLTVEEFHPYILEGIQAKFYIPTHYNYQDPRISIEFFPDAVLFSDTLESWQMP
jgi:L-ascorbate metabolism protein UlaG (beta-lactamase superfamily)